MAIVICVAFALGWGFIGYAIGMAFAETTEAGIVLGILGFLIGLGANLSGVQWIHDMSGNYEKNNIDGINIDHNYSDHHNEIGNNADHDDYSESIFCHKCGNRVTEGIFCSKCGTKLMR